jgi:hypothetical protein
LINFVEIVLVVFQPPERLRSSSHSYILRLNIFELFENKNQLGMDMDQIIH